MDPIGPNYDGPLLLKRYKQILEQENDLVNSIASEALEYVKANTYNIKDYEMLAQKLELDTDVDWIDQARVRASEELAKVSEQMLELKAQFNGDQVEQDKAIITKVKILIKIGEYSDARSTLQEIYETSDDRYNIDVALASILLDQWPYARTVCSKVVSSKTATSKADQLQRSIYSEIFGVNVTYPLLHALTYLRMGDFEVAIGMLLGDGILTAETTGKIVTEEPLVTHRDISVYIALTAIATFTRRDLQYLLDKDPVLARLLETAEQAGSAAGNSFNPKSIITWFLEVKFDKVFTELKKHENSFKTDLVLGPKYQELYDMIRQKAIMQYLSIFDMLPLSNYFAQFGEDICELTSLIRKKNLPYRINARLDVIELIDPTKEEYLYDSAETAYKDFTLDSVLSIWSFNAYQKASFSQLGSIDERLRGN